MSYRQRYLRKLARQVLPKLLALLANSTNEIDVIHERSKPITYMIKKDSTFQMIKESGELLLALVELPETIVLPNSPQELSSLIAQAMIAKARKVNLPIYTPVCPDWSRDDQGRYDFKSLGDGMSFISQKFFNYVPPLLEIFARFGVPYEGHLLFADYGFETEIVAKDSYGAQLSQDEIERRLDSTLKLVSKRIEELSGSEGNLFRNYQIVPMTVFFQNRGFNPGSSLRQMVSLFESDSRGIRLIEEIHRGSFSLNQKRFGLGTEEENRRMIRRTLAEYATLGQSLGERGVIVACESMTSSKSYNLFRDQKLPLFYIKGKKGEVGENIF